MKKTSFLLLFLACITVVPIAAQDEHPPENMEDSIKLYIKPSTSAITGEITYKSPVFFAAGDKGEKLVVQLNTNAAKSHIEITFLTQDLICNQQGERIEVGINEENHPLLINSLVSNCRGMQAVTILKPQSPPQEYQTDHSETMFLSFFNIKHFVLRDKTTYLTYYLDEQTAEKFRVLYKCFEHFTGMWE